jgi:hypothetical protein
LEEVLSPSDAFAVLILLSVFIGVHRCSSVVQRFLELTTHHNPGIDPPPLCDVVPTTFHSRTGETGNAFTSAFSVAGVFRGW